MDARRLDRLLQAHGHAPQTSLGSAAETLSPPPEVEPVPEDPVTRILHHGKTRDYFSMLELPPPTLDALGRPSWEVPAADISKAYRRLSVRVHPDKLPGPEAREAFELLNAAHRALTDPGELVRGLRGRDRTRMWLRSEVHACLALIAF